MADTVNHPVVSFVLSVSTSPLTVLTVLCPLKHESLPASPRASTPGDPEGKATHLQHIEDLPTMAYALAACLATKAVDMDQSSRRDMRRTSGKRFTTLLAMFQSHDALVKSPHECSPAVDSE